MYHFVSRVVALLVAWCGEPFPDVLVRRVAFDLGTSGGMLAADADNVVQDGPHVPVRLHAPWSPPSAGGALEDVVKVSQCCCVVNAQMYGLRDQVRPDDGPALHPGG